MDSISCAVLGKICALTPIGKYIIVSEEELFEAMPEGSDDGGELKKALRTLISGGFIDLKYSDGNLFCVAPLKKYVAEPEIQVEEKPATAEPVPRKNDGKALLFWAAFFGGAAGSLIISLIFAFF